MVTSASPKRTLADAASAQSRDRESMLFGSEVLEAAPGFEPGIRALQARALPLGYAASKGSAIRGHSNALPSHFAKIVAHRMYQQAQRESIEPPRPVPAAD